MPSQSHALLLQCCAQPEAAIGAAAGDKGGFQVNTVSTHHGCLAAARARRSSRIGLLEVPGMPWPRTRPSFAATPRAGSSPELAGKEDRGFFKSLHIALRLAIFRFQLANALVLGGGWFSNTAQARLLCVKLIELAPDNTVY